MTKTSRPMAIEPPFIDNHDKHLVVRGRSTCPPYDQLLSPAYLDMTPPTGARAGVHLHQSAGSESASWPRRTRRMPICTVAACVSIVIEDPLQSPSKTSPAGSWPMSCAGWLSGFRAWDVPWRLSLVEPSERRAVRACLGLSLVWSTRTPHLTPTGWVGMRDR